MRALRIPLLLLEAIFILSLLAGCTVHPALSPTSEPAQTAAPLRPLPTATSFPSPPAVPSVTASAAPEPTPTASDLPAIEAATPAEFTSSTDNARVFGEAGSLVFEPWEMITSLAWSPDGVLLAAGVGDTLALVSTGPFELASRTRLGPLTHSLAFTSAGPTLAAASHDGQVRLWSLDGSILPEDVRTWAAHKKGANQVAFSPDGRYLASGGNDAMVRVWDLESGEAVQEIIGGTFAVPGLAFDSTGENLYIVNGDLARVRTVAEGRMKATLHPAEKANLYSLALNDSDSLAAAGDAQGRIWLWSLPASNEVEASGVLQMGTASGGLVWSLDFSPDGKLLAAAYADGHIRIWDPKGELLADLAAHQKPATVVRFSPDGHLAASGGLDGLLRLWRVILGP